MNNSKLLLQWLKEEFDQDFGTPVGIADVLYDGVLMCRLLNKYYPGTVGKIQARTKLLPILQNNSDAFLRALPKIDPRQTIPVFHSPDCVRKKNIDKVVLCLLGFRDHLMAAGLLVGGASPLGSSSSGASSGGLFTTGTEVPAAISERPKTSTPENECVILEQWIAAEFPGVYDRVDAQKPVDLVPLLYTGVLLCDLVNKYYPGSVKRVKRQSAFPAILQDNGNAFLRALKEIDPGVKIPRFNPQDCARKKNMDEVVLCLLGFRALLEREEKLGVKPTSELPPATCPLASSVGASEHSPNTVLPDDTEAAARAPRPTQRAPTMSPMSPPASSARAPLASGTAGTTLLTPTALPPPEEGGAELPPKAGKGSISLLRQRPWRASASGSVSAELTESSVVTSLEVRTGVGPHSTGSGEDGRDQGDDTGEDLENGVTGAVLPSFIGLGEPLQDEWKLGVLGVLQQGAQRVIELGALVETYTERQKQLEGRCDQVERELEHSLKQHERLRALATRLTSQLQSAKAMGGTGPEGSGSSSVSDLEY